MTFPIFDLLEIDLSSMCNRDCWWCPRFTDRSGVRKEADNSKVNKSAPTNKVLSIIDQAAELGFKGFIDFHRMSEPFLDSRYLFFAKYAKEKGFKVKVNTNGDLLLNNPKLCAEVDKVVCFIQIGIYDSIDEDDIMRQKMFWKGRFPTCPMVCFSLPEKNLNMRRGSRHYEETEKDKTILELPCATMRALRIRYDGVMAMCCDDDWNAFDLGNAFETPIKDLWWGDKHIALRESLSKPGGRKLNKFCSECYLTGIPVRHLPDGTSVKPIHGKDY